MRKIPAITGAIAAMFLALTAMPALADIKIGVLRSGELTAKAPQFKAAQDQLKAKFDRRNNDLQAEGKKLQDDVAAYKKEADLLSPADRAKKEKDLTARGIDLDSKGRQLQEDFNKERQEQLSKAMTAIRGVIEAVAKEKNLDLIVDEPVFAKPELDITADVLKRLQTAGGK